MFDHWSEPKLAGLVWLMLTAALGAALYLHRRKHRRELALGAMSAPSQWPITARELVNPHEHEVWLWLCEVFADHHVMLKVALVRYVAASLQADTGAWHKQLSNIYCAFTVCDLSGTVIGCADLVERSDADKLHWYVKESVLGKCGIPYVMIKAGHLPSVQALRAAFIGKIDLEEVEVSGAPGPAKPADHAVPGPEDAARPRLLSRLERKRTSGLAASGPDEAPATCLSVAGPGLS